MPNIVNKNTKVLIQGITGKVGRSFAKKMIEDGTNLVCGVTPGKGGEKIFDVPIFNSIEEALQRTNADTCLSVVPAPYLRDAILEAIYSGIGQIIIYTENVPLHDEMEIVYYAKLKGVRVLGPASAGVVSPGKANVSDLNTKYLRKGNIGIVSKSGTITYEVLDGLNEIGLGVSTLVCLGGDRIVATKYTDILPLFEQDLETKAIIMIGEIGGTAELEAATYIKKMNKKVFAYVAGQFAPPGKRMGHAGAIVNRDETDSAKAKTEVLKKAGALVAWKLNDIPTLVAEHFLNENNKKN